MVLKHCSSPLYELYAYDGSSHYIKWLRSYTQDKGFGRLYRHTHKIGRMYVYQKGHMVLMISHWDSNHIRHNKNTF